ncbi:MAG: AmmeMemoRadiSam system protein B [Deltaproteobacteria bacterium]|nr:AmmeMemoRadiSam system protein B [Deltaproteobacteria bacterium]
MNRRASPDDLLPALLRTSVLAVLLGVAACAQQPQEPPPEPVSEVVMSERPTPPPLPVRVAQGPYKDVRKPAVAGSWYPGDAEKLAAEVDGFLAATGATGDCETTPMALVSPHAGYAYSGPTAAFAYAEVRGCPVHRVWLLGPSHRFGFSGAAVYDKEAFRTPLGDLPIDLATAARIADKPGLQWITRDDGGEHSMEIQLPLLQRTLGAFELVPILVGQLDAEQAKQIAEALRSELGPGDLVVVSTDFTHYGRRFDYRPFEDDLPEKLSALDHGAWEPVAAGDPDGFRAYIARTGATVCGRHPLEILAALLPEGAKATELSYTTSGEITGDWSNTVSYLAARIDGPGWKGRGPQTGGARLVSEEAATALLELARKSLVHWFEVGRPLDVDPSTLPEDATRELGAFVTLTKHGALRGCIGEIKARRPVWKAVTSRAVDAAIHDGRFPPVSAEELPELEVEVSLLGPTWQVPGPEAVVVGRHGVVVSSGLRNATYLPQVGPEQGWDRHTMLLSLLRKAGLPPAALEGARIEVYEAQVTPHVGL